MIKNIKYMGLGLGLSLALFSCSESNAVGSSEPDVQLDSNKARYVSVGEKCQYLTKAPISQSTSVGVTLASRGLGTKKIYVASKDNSQMGVASIWADGSIEWDTETSPWNQSVKAIFSQGYSSVYFILSSGQIVNRSSGTTYDWKGNFSSAYGNVLDAEVMGSELFVLTNQGIYKTNFSSNMSSFIKTDLPGLPANALSQSRNAFLVGFVQSWYGHTANTFYDIYVAGYDSEWQVFGDDLTYNGVTAVINSMTVWDTSYGHFSQLSLNTNGDLAVCPGE